jgi:hypothetical protein
MTIVTGIDAPGAPEDATPVTVTEATWACSQPAARNKNKVERIFFIVKLL